MMDDDEDFEHQLQQEADERHRQDAGRDPGNKVDSGATRVDEDGTVFEFDMEKRAWFPKIDDDFIAKYQMNYGMDNTTTTAESTTTTDTVTTTTTTTTTDTKAATDYAAYYQQYYGNTSTQPADAKAYWDYYNKYCNEYYKSQQAGKNKPEDGTTTDATTTKEAEKSPSDNKDATSDVDISSTNEDSKEDGQNPEKETKTEGENLGTADDAQPEYDYAAYYHYYYSHYDTSGENNTEGGGETDSKSEGAKTAKPIAFEPTGNKEYDDYWSTYFSQNYVEPEEDEKEGKDEDAENNAEGEAGKKAKKGEKRKEPEAGWFDVDMEKLTSVYVSGLPVDVTDDEFKELMNKCGLVMYDVRSRKPKLKLYKDHNGANKGDGLCCYIKPESVELALQILDGYELRGHRLNVELAQFELKGDYDPSKKKKKLSNREKKRMKKQQEKLFNWHLEKDAPVRQKRERIVIVKNLFDPDVFEGNPVLINKIRDDLRNECSKHGDVRKVIIYDRHQEGVASVIFKLAEEADVCTAAMNNRMWGKRVITAQAWDGNTKYEVEETEAEREKRINEWENFLEGKDGAEGKPKEKKDGEAKSDDKKNDLGKSSEGVDKGQVKEGGGEKGQVKEEGGEKGGDECVDKEKVDVCGEGKTDEKDTGSEEMKDIAGEEEERKEEGGEGKLEEGIDAENSIASPDEQADKNDTEAAKLEEGTDAENSIASPDEQADKNDTEAAKMEEGTDAENSIASPDEQADKNDTEAAKPEEEAEDVETRSTEKMETDQQEDTEEDKDV